MTGLLRNIRPETEKIDLIMGQDLSAAIDNPLLSEVIKYAVFNGGKRIRPLLTILSAGLEGCNSPDLYRLALTFEYLHAASLLHDDVIDHADERRGRKAANKVWSNTHVILAGDFLHSHAMRLAGTVGGISCLKVICRATAAMVESEFLQLQNAEKRETAESYYFAVLRGKTAALIAAACETGAIFADSTRDKKQALALFGTNLGLAFQIIDDLLDYLGDEAKTGKAVGNDFQEGKMTLPLLYALRGDSNDSRELKELLANTAADRNSYFTRARDIISITGGFTAARQRAVSLIDEALAALNIFPDSSAKDTLHALAHYVLERDK
ncbi:Octaprenyl-diphosphate synthase / Dimethylallyltransferase / Geranyltranstransferase (farnesyldiphosphate synthase) / Geranylgeranyl pyrophosphate synthetase [hydrothermal vent metagenome]|uniref:Octaprenyl-diphosphate synthase / Dimethylallyltransferase / Geranyltranstransferase (Farnesyldiphosphate synthase) / Geranylgeranyl pyrophosphate synthetase n=1 Tax=hydrothermal vent metagenome TaxID=652676 RepID=A0A3B0WEL4_9ZZZZ